MPENSSLPSLTEQYSLLGFEVLIVVISILEKICIGVIWTSVSCVIAASHQKMNTVTTGETKEI